MTPTPAELRQELLSGPTPQLSDPLERGIADLDRLAAEVGGAALDPAVFGSGGAAFLWEDLLSLEDAVAAAGGVLAALTPDAQAGLLLKLVLFWRKLRIVRVMLDQGQYRVMRTVKRHPRCTPAEVARRLGRPEAEVVPVVNALKAKEYRNGVMLLEEKDGRLTTQF